MSILVNANEHEISKAYTPGAITYHTAAASEEGRKKRAAQGRAKTGVTVAAGSAYLHQNSGAAAKHVADAADKRSKANGSSGITRALLHADNTVKANRAFRRTGKVGMAGGAALAVGGAVSAGVHGSRRKKHFDAAQAGRLQREPAISKGIAAALDDAVLAPVKIKDAKAAIAGKGATTPPAGSTTVTPGTTKPKGTVSADIAQVSNVGTPATPIAKNAFGIYV